MGPRSTDRPLAFWLASDPATDGPDPWSARDTADTDPAPPPVSGRRYALIDPERAALPPRSSTARRVERRTDPCVVPPPGSDRGGDVGARVTVLPPLWGRGEGGGGTTDGEEE